MCIRSILKISIALAWLCLSLGLAPQCGFAQTNGLKDGLSGKKFVSQTHGGWKIDAARISFDQERKVYEAEGNVRIYSGDRSIQADWAELNTERHIVELRGNVLLKYGKDWLKGEYLIWNLEEETGSVDGGLAYFAESTFYAQGARITKTGPNQYELKDGFITSCDPSNSDWKIRYKDMSINLDGIAWAKHTSFWVRRIPLFYSPFLLLPIQQKRQSGFLMPWAGSSDLNGLQIEVPFYWAIREDMDATLYGRYMENRGFMSGIEYRIAHETWGEGIWLLNYLRDQANKEELEDANFPFQKKDRYWLRSRHSFDLPKNIHGNLDLDLVSDRNFLREFDKGSTSFDFTDKLFRELSGRGVLSDETILARESSLYLEQRHESSALSMDARYWDQLDRPFEDETLQRLPSLAYNIIPSWIDDQSPFYYTFEGSWVNYWRREGDLGNRLDIHPRLYYPLHWKTFLNVEPSVGLRAASYWVDWHDDRHAPVQGRLFTDLNLELSTRLNRVYPVKLGNYVALEHAVRPEITYEYIPDGLEGEIPFFDRFDRDPSRHDVRYGFSTFLTAKEVQKDADGNDKNVYREFARLQAFQAFNIEPPANLPDPRFNVVQKKGFSDVGLRLDLMPRPYLTLSYNTDYSPDLGEFTLQDLYMTLDSTRGHTLRLDYQFRNNSFIDELITQVNLKVLPNVFFLTYHDYSFEQDELFSHGYGIKYQHGCWAVGFAYENKDNDHRFAVSVNLLGLGTFAGSHRYTPSDDVPIGTP